jgi:processive 1,2-diacylglycerol beta-glucosyltransferase
MLSRSRRARVNRYRLHVLYEHGSNGRPYASSYIRLLRPFTHPAVSTKVEMTAGIEFDGRPVDAVVVDRLWRPHIGLTTAQRLVASIRSAGARFIYTLDDNLFELVREHKDWRPTDAQLQALKFFLQEADRVVVSTPALCEAVAPYTSRVTVIANLLDERLLKQRYPPAVYFAHRVASRYTRSRRMTIGYMGTLTHDDDVSLILPVLRRVCDRRPGRVQIEILGVIGHPETLEKLAGLPIQFLTPPNSEYPLFLRWFAGACRWDIGLAPLENTVFNSYKSDIKFLDYAAIGAAGIFSRTKGYAASVRHGQTGLLIEDHAEAWEDALETLLQRRSRAFSLGFRAQTYLYRHRTLLRGGREWLDMLAGVLA